MRRAILTLMAHPDDAEILCGGTLVLLAERGWEIHIATATPGDCGSATLSAEVIAAIRRREAGAAAAVLGGTYHCLERRDLLVRYDEETLRQAVGVIRATRPDVIVTHSSNDYMVDHEQISLVARAAAFGAPMPNAPAPPGTAPTEAVPCLYYADPVEGLDARGRTVVPDLLIDIESTLETKLQLIAVHASQREWLRKHHGEDEYLESARRWSRTRGALAGLQYAEGFRQHLGHAYPRADLVGEALGDLAQTYSPTDTPETS